jgi:glycosyltransferase involved in cell wall biosynthesis
MKVMRIITRLNTGGPSIQAMNLSAELTRLGHDCTLLFGRCSDHEGSMEHELYSTRNYWAWQIPDLRRDLSWSQDMKAFKDIRMRMTNMKPDIVHTHHAKAGALARLAALFVSPMPKLIHTYHGHTFHSYFSPLKTKLIILIERFLARFTHAIVAISESQKKELVETYRIAPAHKVRVIPNGFDLSRFLELEPMFHNKRWKGTNNRVAIGIIGRIAPVKNHDLFFEFCSELAKHFAVEIDVIGDGDGREEMLMKYQEVKFTRWYPHWQMPEVYKYLDIIVNSSKNEGTPTVLIEAMAAGRLVVATPVGGNKDLMGMDGGRGIYLHEDNLDMTIRQIKHWLDGGLHIMLNEAREYVRKNHSLDRLVKDIEGLYNSFG